MQERNIDFTGYPVGRDIRECICLVLDHLFSSPEEGLHRERAAAIVRRALPSSEPFPREVEGECGASVRLDYPSVISRAVFRILHREKVMSCDGPFFYVTSEALGHYAGVGDSGTFISYFAGFCATRKEGELERMRAEIDILYLQERIFFRPWIGESYLEGIAGKRVLILGASRYCTKSEGCPKRGDCIGELASRNRYLGLRDSCVLGKGSEDGDSLSTVNEFVIRAYLRQRDGIDRNKAVPETYRFFDDVMLRGYLPFRSSREIWQHVSFFNFLAFLLGDKDRKTPGYGLFGKEYEASLDVMNLLMGVLKPDKVILWGAAVRSYLSRMRLLTDRFLPIMHPSSGNFGRGEVGRRGLECLRKEFNPLR